MKWSQLRALFSPRRYLLRADEATPLGAGRFGREGILPRGGCRYRRFSLERLPAQRRAEALRIQIEQWSPYERYASHVAWHGTDAQVWVWPEERAQALEQRVGRPLRRCLPETVLYPPAAADGARLLRCQEGVEGQVWQAGILKGSQWWSRLPTDDEWSRFLRAHGLAPAQLPEPEALPMLERPWGTAAMAGVGSGLARQERLWVAAGAFLLALGLVWQSVVWLKWNLAIDGMESRINALTAQAEPILAARNSAFDELQRGERLATLWVEPAQVELMAAIADKTPAGARWVEWRYEMGDLRLTVVADQHDARAYVSNFQSIPGVDSVTTEAGRDKNQFVIKMKVNHGGAVADGR